MYFYRIYISYWFLGKNKDFRCLWNLRPSYYQSYLPSIDAKKERNPLAWREFVVSQFTKAARESLLFSSCKSSDLSVYLINAFYDTIEYNWTVKTVTVTVTCWYSLEFNGLFWLLFNVVYSGEFWSVWPVMSHQQ